MRKSESARAFSPNIRGSAPVYVLSALPLILVAVVTVLQVHQEAVYPELHAIHHGKSIGPNVRTHTSSGSWRLDVTQPRDEQMGLAGFAQTSAPDVLESAVAGHASALVQQRMGAPVKRPPLDIAHLQQQAAMGAVHHQQAQAGTAHAAASGAVLGAQAAPSVLAGGANVSAGGTDGSASLGAVKLAAWQLPRFVGDGVEPSLPSILLATTTGDRFERIFDWYRYHRAIGVDVFYLFLEGHAAEPDCVEKLNMLPGIVTFLRTDELEKAHASSRIWNETWLAAFFDKPCNYELFVRQNLNLETAIRKAFREGLDWILHIDTDELLYPGGTPAYGLKQLLGSVPKEVETLVFPNYETAVERDNVQDPFVEVTMFKRNFDHVIKEVYFKHYKETSRGNPNYFLTYGNGKAAARIVPGLRPNGAHRFHNYNHAPLEAKAEEAAVLHYTYARFDDVVTRRGRCNCGNTDKEIEKCFILAFDRLVFKTAAQVKDDELRKWYRDRVVWGNREFNRKMLANGLFARIHTPSVLVMGLRAAGTHDAYADGIRPLLHPNKTRPDSQWIAMPMKPRQRPPAQGSVATVFKHSPPTSHLSSSVKDARAAVAQLRGKGGFSAAMLGLGQAGTTGSAAAKGSASAAFPPPKILVTGKAAAWSGSAAADGVDPNAGQAEDAFVPADPPLPAPEPPALRRGAGGGAAQGGGGGGAANSGVVGGAARGAEPKAAMVDAVQAHAHAVRGGRKRVGDGADAGGAADGSAGKVLARGDGAGGARDHRQHEKGGQHGDFLAVSRGGAKRAVPAATQHAAVGALLAGGVGASAQGQDAALAAPPAEPQDPETKAWQQLQEQELEEWQQGHLGELTTFEDDPPEGGAEEGDGAAAGGTVVVEGAVDALASGVGGEGAEGADAEAAAPPPAVIYRDRGQAVKVGSGAQQAAAGTGGGQGAAAEGEAGAVARGTDAGEKEDGAGGGATSGFAQAGGESDGKDAGDGGGLVPVNANVP